jgi:hypothetical protein
MPPLGEPELIDALRKRLDALDGGLTSQMKKLNEIEMEWSEWYDKFRLMFARLSKRIKDAAQVEGEPPQPLQDAPGRTNGVRPIVGPRHPTMRNYRG